MMAHLEIEIHDNLMAIRSQAFYWEFPDVGKNKKAILALLRAVRSPETGKPLFTYQELADAFGYKARQNVENFVAEFHASGDDFAQFLSRVNTKRDRLFPLVEAQILSAPGLSLHQHYLTFCEAHAGERLSETTFRQYVNDIEGSKILKRVQQWCSDGASTRDVTRYLQEVLALETVSQVKQKEIAEVFPEVKASVPDSRRNRGDRIPGPAVESKILVVVLYVCGLSQEMLGLLFGVGPTSIHNWIYTICSEDLDWQILQEITRWSGQVCFDEKWIKINGVWYFGLCAVDSVSGFPLLIDLYPTLDTISWTLFFKRFKAVYGVPTLIQSDGSRALAAARQAVFSGVRYQLCKFHKLKNLLKRLRHAIRDTKRLNRCVRLARHIFSNTGVSSRKYAAKTLQTLAGEDVSSDLDAHIFACWRHLTLSLTSNASERFNRKIEKCVAARYGIPSVESARVLLRGLWLKELFLNGQQHVNATSELGAIALSRMCQDHLDTGNILHFFHDYCPSQVAKRA
jgi:transposase-like protein